MPTKTGVARARMSEMAMPGDEIAPVHIINTCFGVVQDAPVGRMGRPVQGDDPGLSVRAINVLKIMAGEIMGEVPERAGWVPPEALLRKITVERLSTARNCGPRTLDEILRWAEARGVTIQPLFHAGKSLSETWRDLSTKFAAGGLTKAELAEALEKSVRRKSTKMPVAIQRILLTYLSKVGGDIRRR
jgi:hypothetical protein